MKITLSTSQLGEILEQFEQQGYGNWVAAIGTAFASGSDDDQARILCAAAKALPEAVEEYRSEHPGSLNMGADWQWGQVGKHLVDCECSTAEGRELVALIFEGMLREYVARKPPSVCYSRPVDVMHLGGGTLSLRLGLGEAQVTLYNQPADQIKAIGEQLIAEAEKALEAERAE